MKEDTLILRKIFKTQGVNMETTELKTLKKGISFPGGSYAFSGILTSHLQEYLSKNPGLDFNNLSKAIYNFTHELKQFDYLELPDGTTFKKDFEPNK